MKKMYYFYVFITCLWNLQNAVKKEFHIINIISINILRTISKIMVITLQQNIYLNQLFDGTGDVYYSFQNSTRSICKQYFSCC